jgi:hypothetical protein
MQSSAHTGENHSAHTISVPQGHMRVKTIKDSDEFCHAHTGYPIVSAHTKNSQTYKTECTDHHTRQTRNRETLTHPSYTISIHQTHIHSCYQNTHTHTHTHTGMHVHTYVHQTHTHVLTHTYTRVHVRTHKTIPHTHTLSLSSA